MLLTGGRGNIQIVGRSGKGAFPDPLRASQPGARLHATSAPRDERSATMSCMSAPFTTSAALASSHSLAPPTAGSAVTATVSLRGAERWSRGHPWIYRSDVARPPEVPPGIVRVQDTRGRALGVALWSPASEISLRLLTRDASATIGDAWWHDRLAQAIARRRPLAEVATAYRLVHGEADGLPSLVVDRYDRWLVVQFMSAGLESARESIVTALQALTGAEGILARNDAALRTREALPRETVVLVGEVPTSVSVAEYGVRYLAAPWTGQKTGAFLDQRENRALVGRVARGRALDCFSYHGSFALHLARQAETVLALDSSAAALERARGERRA